MSSTFSSVYKNLCCNFWTLKSLLRLELSHIQFRLFRNRGFPCGWGPGSAASLPLQEPPWYQQGIKVVKMISPFQTRLASDRIISHINHCNALFLKKSLFRDPVPLGTCLTFRVPIYFSGTSIDGAGTSNSGVVELPFEVPPATIQDPKGQTSWQHFQVWGVYRPLQPKRAIHYSSSQTIIELYSYWFSRLRA